ncbi:MAG TPA: DUF4091 domain-containing protein, partial [Candidatus Hydrogenedentes bacterium]|nr:DUF4091 domain-containing protein [Candidatus Hydrogenedentota bacterium]
PEGRAVEVRIEVTQNGAMLPASSVASSEQMIEHEFSYSVPANQAVNLTLSCAVLEEGRILVRRTHTAYLAPFVQELGDASRMLAETEALLPQLIDAAGLEERHSFLQARLGKLEPKILTAGALTESGRGDLRNATHAFINEVKRLRDVARAARYAAEKGNVVFLVAANPWAPFGGLDEIGEGRVDNAALAVEAFHGETESAALNIFNMSSRPRTFRVTLDGMKREAAAVPARDAVSLHEVVAVPTQMRDFSADALPLLNGAELLHVPAWDARQLWLNINTAALSPGEWSGRLRLGSLDIEPIAAEADIRLTVWGPRMPGEQPLSLCHWGYVHRSMLKDWPEEALADQVRNGTNVFVGTIHPAATYNEQGEIVGDIDFSAHDAYVKRHAPHGMILFFNYQRSLKGPGDMDSDAYAKAHVQWLRAWAAHLKQLGVDHAGYALYPVDEPGLSDGLVEHYLLMAKLAREADPDILLYTDPVGRITEDELREMTPYVDIWCPNRNGLILDDKNAAKLDIIKGSGATVWMYECDGNVKHQSPLGYYRAQAWLAWHHGMTGIGFWSYCTSQDDPWFRPTLRHDYLMVYPGRGVVSSKRWEAVRDGVEDYTMLAKLRGLVEAAEDNIDAEDLDAARALLSEGVHTIAVFCGMDDDNTLPGPDGMSCVRRVADTRWKKIQDARRALAGLLARIE